MLPGIFPRHWYSPPSITEKITVWNAPQPPCAMENALRSNSTSADDGDDIRGSVL